MSKRVKTIGLSAFGLVILVCTAVALLFYKGIWHLNHPSVTEYPVRGVDVSSYQGTIDWRILSDQDIAFAFIKATEGSSFVDECFQKNWANAEQTGLYVGAYHFFSFESAGRLQAEHYIATVGALRKTSLPPVIDIEYYDVPDGTDTTAATVRRELGAMIEALTAYYGKPPLLYVTKASYTDFIQGYFTECPLWVRSVYSEPDFISPDEWTFWQYSNRHRLEGYEGEEAYMDMNVYNGSMDAFLKQFSL